MKVEESKLFGEFSKLTSEPCPSLLCCAVTRTMLRSCWLKCGGDSFREPHTPHGRTLAERCLRRIFPRDRHNHIRHSRETCPSTRNVPHKLCRAVDSQNLQNFCSGTAQAASNFRRKEHPCPMAQSRARISDFAAAQSKSSDRPYSARCCSIQSLITVPGRGTREGTCCAKRACAHAVRLFAQKMGQPLSSGACRWTP